MNYNKNVRRVYRTIPEPPFYEMHEYEIPQSISNNPDAIIQHVADEHRREFPNDNILEISTASPSNLGKDLSAFRLKIRATSPFPEDSNEARLYPVECAYQSGKVFDGAGPVLDLLKESPAYAKRRIKNIATGRTLIGFRGFNNPYLEFGLKPESAFYNYIYTFALHQAHNKNLINGLVQGGYNAFSDVYFGGNSLSSQCQAAAIFMGLYNTKQLQAWRSKEEFLQTVYSNNSDANVQIANQATQQAASGQNAPVQQTSDQAKSDRAAKEMAAQQESINNFREYQNTRIHAQQTAQQKNGSDEIYAPITFNDVQIIKNSYGEGKALSVLRMDYLFCEAVNTYNIEFEKIKRNELDDYTDSIKNDDSIPVNRKEDLISDKKEQIEREMHQNDIKFRAAADMHRRKLNVIFYETGLDDPNVNNEFYDFVESGRINDYASCVEFIINNIFKTLPSAGTQYALNDKAIENAEIALKDRYKNNNDAFNRFGRLVEGGKIPVTGYRFQNCDLGFNLGMGWGVTSLINYRDKFRYLNELVFNPASLIHVMIANDSKVYEDQRENTARNFRYLGRSGIFNKNEKDTKPRNVVIPFKSISEYNRVHVNQRIDVYDPVNGSMEKLYTEVGVICNLATLNDYAGYSKLRKALNSGDYKNLLKQASLESSRELYSSRYPKEIQDEINAHIDNKLNNKNMSLYDEAYKRRMKASDLAVHYMERCSREGIPGVFDLKNDDYGLQLSLILNKADADSIKMSLMRGYDKKMGYSCCEFMKNGIRYGFSVQRINTNPKDTKTDSKEYFTQWVKDPRISDILFDYMVTGQAQAVQPHITEKGIIKYPSVGTVGELKVYGVPSDNFHTEAVLGDNENEVFDGLMRTADRNRANEVKSKLLQNTVYRTSSRVSSMAIIPEGNPNSNRNAFEWLHNVESITIAAEYDSHKIDREDKIGLNRLAAIDELNQHIQSARSNFARTVNLEQMLRLLFDQEAVQLNEYPTDDTNTVIAALQQSVWDYVRGKTDTMINLKKLVKASANKNPDLDEDSDFMTEDDIENENEANQEESSDVKSKSEIADKYHVDSPDAVFDYSDQVLKADKIEERYSNALLFLQEAMDNLIGRPFKVGKSGEVTYDTVKSKRKEDDKSERIYKPNVDSIASFSTFETTKYRRGLRILKLAEAAGMDGHNFSGVTDDALMWRERLAPIKTGKDWIQCSFLKRALKSKDDIFNAYISRHPHNEWIRKYRNITSDKFIKNMIDGVIETLSNSGVVMFDEIDVQGQKQYAIRKPNADDIWINKNGVLYWEGCVANLQQHLDTASLVVNPDPSNAKNGFIQAVELDKNGNQKYRNAYKKVSGIVGKVLIPGHDDLIPTANVFRDNQLLCVGFEGRLLGQKDVYTYEEYFSRIAVKNYETILHDALRSEIQLQLHRLDMVYEEKDAKASSIMKNGRFFSDRRWEMDITNNKHLYIIKRFPANYRELHIENYFNNESINSVAARLIQLRDKHKVRMVDEIPSGYDIQLKKIQELFKVPKQKQEENKYVPISEDNLKLMPAEIRENAEPDFYRDVFGQNVNIATPSLVSNIFDEADTVSGKLPFQVLNMCVGAKPDKSNFNRVTAPNENTFKIAMDTMKTQMQYEVEEISRYVQDRDDADQGLEREIIKQQELFDYWGEMPKLYPDGLSYGRALNPEMRNSRYDSFDRRQQYIRNSSNSVVKVKANIAYTMSAGNYEDGIVISKAFADRTKVTYLDRSGKRRTRPLQVGDKLDQGHADKGVISMIIDPANNHAAEGEPKFMKTMRDLFASNPELDAIFSSSSILSRTNLGELKDGLEHHKPLVSPDGKIVEGGMVEGFIAVTDHLVDLENKNYKTDFGAPGKRISSLMVNALTARGADGIIHHFFKDNHAPWFRYREKLIAIGMDLSSDGAILPAYHYMKKNEFEFAPYDEQRKVFALDLQPLPYMNDNGNNVIDIEALIGDGYKKKANGNDEKKPWKVSDYVAKIQGEFCAKSGFLETRLPLRFRINNCSTILPLTKEAVDPVTGEVSRVIDTDYSSNKYRVKYGGAEGSYGSYIDVKNDDAARENLTFGLPIMAESLSSGFRKNDDGTSGSKTGYSKYLNNTLRLIAQGEVLLSLSRTRYFENRQSDMFDFFKTVALKTMPRGIHEAICKDYPDAEKRDRMIYENSATYLFKAIDIALGKAPGNARSAREDILSKCNDYIQAYGLNPADIAAEYDKAKDIFLQLDGLFKPKKDFAPIKKTDDLFDILCNVAKVYKTLDNFETEIADSIESPLRQFTDRNSVFAKIQNSFDQVSTPLTDEMKGNKNIVKEELMSTNVKESAYLVGTSRADLPLNTVMIGSKVAKELGIKDGDYALITRDPLWRENGVMAPQFRVEDEDASNNGKGEVSGIAMHPCMAKAFDGDFDGDHWAVFKMDNKDPRLLEEMKNKLSLEASIVDLASCIDDKAVADQVVSEYKSLVNGNTVEDTLNVEKSIGKSGKCYDMVFNTGGLVAYGFAKTPELKEHYNQCIIKANVAYFAYKNGHIDGEAFRQMNRDAYQQANEIMTAVFDQQESKEFMDFSSEAALYQSIYDINIKTKVKGKPAQLIQAAATLGHDIEIDAENDNVKVIKECPSGIPESRDNQQQFAMLLKSNLVGSAGKTAQMSSVVGKNSPVIAVYGYLLAQSVLQIKKDPVRAVRMIHVIAGALSQYAHSGAVSLLVRTPDHELALDEDGNAYLDVRSPRSDLTRRKGVRYRCYDEESQEYAPVSVYLNSFDLMNTDDENVRRLIRLINPKVMEQMLNDLIINDAAMGISIVPDTLSNAVKAMTYENEESESVAVAGIKDYSAPKQYGGLGHDFVDPALQYAFYNSNFSFIQKEISNALRTDEDRVEAAPMFSDSFRYLPDDHQRYIDLTTGMDLSKRALKQAETGKIDSGKNKEEKAADILETDLIKELFDDKTDRITIFSDLKNCNEEFMNAVDNGKLYTAFESKQESIIQNPKQNDRRYDQFEMF